MQSLYAGWRAPAYPGQPQRVRAAGNPSFQPKTAGERLQGLRAGLRRGR